ncbi:50S ribosomal protein L40e [Candidatus Woesearchaeota archaeon]|nr:50S ribosomal protein L40e [Candidatus Woesearchaeota archaeon]
MAKFEEAANRKFKNIFICRRCKSKVRATNLKVLAGKVRCRKCSLDKLKPKRKK